MSLNFGWKAHVSMGKNDAITIAKRYADQVRLAYPVDKAYLFGSYAKNKADESSDIDVCIVSTSFGKNYSDEEMNLIRLAVRIDPRISPVPYNPADLEDRWSQLAFEITNYGISL